MQALAEICGIRRFLAEVHRVLKPGGHYVAAYSCEPALYDQVPLADFRRFALDADLYAGHKDFVRTARATGLGPVDTVSIDRPDGALCISTFRKP